MPWIEEDDNGGWVPAQPPHTCDHVDRAKSLVEDARKTLSASHKEIERQLEFLRTLNSDLRTYAHNVLRACVNRENQWKAHVAKLEKLLTQAKLKPPPLPHSLTIPRHRKEET